MGVDKDSQRLYEIEDPRDGLVTENADGSMDGKAKNLDNRDGKAIGKKAGKNLKGTVFDPNPATRKKDDKKKKGGNLKNATF